MESFPGSRWSRTTESPEVRHLLRSPGEIDRDIDVLFVFVIHRGNPGYVKAPRQSAFCSSLFLVFSLCGSPRSERKSMNRATRLAQNDPSKLEDANARPQSGDAAPSPEKHETTFQQIGQPPSTLQPRVSQTSTGVSRRKRITTQRSQRLGDLAEHNRRKYCPRL